MNNKKSLIFIVILSILLLKVFTASAEVTIYYVSSTLNAFTSAQGSKGGGTVLYISGFNFSPNADDIQVFFGNYPCNLIAQGSTVSMVSCITTPMYDPNFQTSLPVTMYTKGLLPLTCTTYLCLFSYSDYYTPFIYEVFPSTAVGNQMMYLAGVHKTINFGDGRSPSASDLRYITIGDTSCSTLDIIQNITNGGGIDLVFCNTFLYQQAGEYNMVERIVYGDALFSWRNFKTSFFTGITYTTRIAPILTPNTIQNGGAFGHILTLLATGFSSIPSNLGSFSCSIGTVGCTVISNPQGSIQIQLPPYKPGYETTGKLTQSLNDNSTQQNPYLGSYGFRYTRYSTTTAKTLDQLIVDFRTKNTTATVLYDGYRTQLSSNYDGVLNYDDYLRGYYYVPVAGSYTFETTVDDSIIVLMSTVQNNSNPANMAIIMRVDTYIPYSEDPYNFLNINNTITLTLSKGYYYMEIISRGGGGVNYYYVSVIMPPMTITAYNSTTNTTNNQVLANPTWKVENILIAAKNIAPQIITITVDTSKFPTNTTSYTLYYYVNTNGVYNKVTTPAIPYKATLAQFQTAIKSLPQFTGYNSSITLTMLTSSSNITSNNATAVIYKYQISFQWTRNALFAKLPYTSVTAVTAVTTQAHSFGIAGTYVFRINGVPLPVYDSSFRVTTTSIQITNSLGHLQNALRSYYNAPELQILSKNTQQLPDQICFNILYFGVYSPEPVQIDTFGMTGGLDDTFTVSVTTSRNFYSNRPYFNAIPYDFLRMAAPSPTILVKYNNIPAICFDCFYKYQSSLPISVSAAAFKPSNTGIKITLSSTNATLLSTLLLSDITITLYGSPCVLDLGSNATLLTCSFNTISCGGQNVPQIPAGNEPAKVHIRQFGFINSTIPLKNDLKVTSVSPTSLGMNGGVIATIIGTGFPSSNTGWPQLLIVPDNNVIIGNAIISSISNCQVQFSFPLQDLIGDQTTTLTYSLVYPTYLYINRDLNRTLSLSSSLDPSVTSLSLQSASPIIKQNIIVTGTNFDTNAANMKAYLYFASNLTQKYELGVLSVANSTSMVVVLGGGRTGDYYLRVLVIGKGMSAPSSASAFSYEIVVNSVSPITGSIGGGYTLTINGANFAPANGSTQVFIGIAVNSICLITSITTTTIQCTVPQMSGEYLVGDLENVLVTGRLIENSRCRGNCTFIYENNDTIYVTLLNGTDFPAGFIVTITTNSSFDTNNTVVKVGTQTMILLSITNTTLSFAYPSLAAGSYAITVSVKGVNAYPILQTTTTLTIGAISSTTGSNKGQIVSVIGNGFTSISDPGNIIYYNCSAIAIILPIQSITPTNVTFEIPSNPSLTCQINVTMKLIFKTYTYSQSVARTPLIVASSLGNLKYLIVASNTNSKTIKFIIARYLDSSGGITTSSYPMSWTLNATNQYIVTPTGGYLPAGTFLIYVSFDTIGFADSTTNQFTVAPTAISTLTPSPVTVSFGGQGSYTLTSSGFITNNIQNNDITICGIRANILSADQNSLTFQIPAFVNAYTHNTYGLGAEQVLTPFANIISDTIVKTNYAFDGSTKSFYSSNNSFCYIGLDFGVGAQANITKIRYMPNAAWIRMDNYFDGAVFEGSNDNTSWSTITTIDSQVVHTGWNVWLSTGSTIFRYVRFSQNNALSDCQLAELEFSGIVYSTTTYNASLPCPLSVVLYGTAQSFPNVITYSAASTSIITSITPAFGPSTGGTLLTIVGSNFDTNVITVVIDGITCTLNSVTTTQITCTTGMRVKPPAGGNSFVATSAGNTVILNSNPFLYMDRWSSTATWGGEVPPRDGDTVYVPAGMTLLVDQSTPFINAIIVDGGRIIFSDEIDMTVDANYFIMIGGEFRAGLPNAPYQHKLTITLHGGYYDKQLPYFGNKVLGCMNCIFNLHGIVRNPTWSQITSTVNPGDNKLTLLDAVDWIPGESIAIAATGYNHFESEQKTIVAVSADKKTLTVDTPFVYRHFSGTENYAGKNFVMNAEVGLLTRNIVIQGDNMTDIYNHGSHLILMGSATKGLNASLSYTEIRRCGQPKIIARYCSHFHLAGEVPNSFVRGLAVHHSRARVLTIHGTHYLLVEKNVGYLVEGHNIFIEDGIETHNIIQDNLMISTIASQTMLQSDTSPASYWITNPLNTVINNHAAGGDFYGFWYEIKPNPDGPSATPNICPTGMRLGPSYNNVAHSHRRFGLRIFNYAARQYPCLPLANQSLVNPFDFNPAYESVFDNYLLWKNQQNGVLGEQLGFVTLSNFFIIDSGASGMQFYVANVSLQNVTAKQSVIVGYSAGNAPSDLTSLRNVRGIITPRTDGFRADGIAFVNFAPLMTPLKSCSKCESILFQVTGGKTSFFNNISFTNIQGNYIYWNNWRREIFIDEDGSLTKPITTSLGLPAGKYGTITPYFDHLNIPGHCYNVSKFWDNSSYCDQTITIRSLLYTNADPFNSFVGQTIRTFKMNNLNDSDQPTTYDIQPMIVIKKSHDILGSWAFPYAVGYSYHTHFELGIDFLHLSLAPSQYWLNNEAIVIKFNYTDQRELYRIGHYYAQKLQTPLITGSNGTMISPTTCQNGDFYHDAPTRHLYVCVSGRNKALREWIDITGVRCQNFCPKSSPIGTREPFTRKWSNATQWPNGTLPKAGDNVTIPYEWNIILDMSPPAFYFVLINGALYFDLKDLTFQANTIWVQQGGIYIGSAAQPFTNKATIILNGNKDDLFTVLDPDASGNKMLAVTGALQFYGSPPSITWTRLTAIAPIGANTITVQNLTGWKVGDEVVIGPTYSGRTEDEVFKIVSISANTITLNGTLQYQHYGDVDALTNSVNGTIDMRAAVGLLTRNIKITRGPDPNNWGCRVQIYSYLMQFSAASKTPPLPVNGYAYFDGVELDGCGQYGSENAGIRIQKLGSIITTDNPTVITRSTIRNCNGYCTYIDRSSNVTFDNNIFHFGKRYHALVLKVTNYAFINNVLIGLRNIVVSIAGGTGLAPNNAAYEQYVPVNSDTDNITVTNNLVQGSEDNGFVFPFTSCSRINNYPFRGNTAGSCFVAFATNVMSGFLCLAAGGFSGYASYIGFIANPPGLLTQVQYTNMFFADNQRGFTLRYAHEIDDNTIMLNNSYFMGYSRPSCPSCYSSTKLSYCNDGHAIRMFTATLSGERFPFNKNMTDFDVICTQESFDAKAFLTDVVFENYQFGINTNIPYCTKMNIFRKHDKASDATAVHNLYNTTCINCDFQSLVYFSPSNPAWQGWAGGCGQLDCTGAINYFIHDHDGKFTQTFNNNSLQPTQLLANNQPIGGNQTACQRVEQWNGYWCKFQQLALLEYQSIAADYNKRMVWPVYLSYDGGSWNSTTNGWKEWEWIAPLDPAERRLARFWSVLKLKQYYNMTYSSQPPSDAVYQIQKRQLPTGNPNDWVIIRIYFPIPNVIIVKVTNTTKSNLLVPGYQQINGAYQDLTKVTGLCGANFYDFQKNVIHFVVNGKSNCQVRLIVSSFVQLTVNFQIEMTSFYTNNGPTSVLTNIMAFLNLDPSQIKIVSINPGTVLAKAQRYFTVSNNAANSTNNSTKFLGAGSTSVKFQIVPPSINKAVNSTTNSSDSTTSYLVNDPRNVTQDSNNLNGYANKFMSGINSNSLNLNYNVLDVSTTIQIISTNNLPVNLCNATYLYNTTSKTCYCDVGFIEIGKQCIACSSLGNSTNLTNPNNTNTTQRCICQPTFIWSDTFKFCICPGNQYIVDIKNKCFSCTGIKNGTGAADTLNACKCNPTYSFMVNNSTCMCPDPQSYILNNICYGCSGFGNGTGKVASTSKNCACLSTFIYDSASGKCICPTGYSVSANNTCIQCPTGLIFKPTKLICGCPNDNAAYFGGACTPCSSANMTGVVANNGIQCVCRPTLAWVNNNCQCGGGQSIFLNGICINCTGNNANFSGKGVVSGNQCSCKNTYIWSAQLGTCICGVNTMLTNGTCYPCSQIANTATSNQSQLASCTCLNNLIFDPIKLVCTCSGNTSIINNAMCVNCASTSFNFSGNGSSSSNQCNCKSTFVWSSQLNACICGVNSIYAKNQCYQCSQFANTVPSNASQLSLCICVNNLIFDPAKLACACSGTTSIIINATCINCAGNNSNFSGKGIVSGNQCSCKTGFVWNAGLAACVCGVNTLYINGTCSPCNLIANTVSSTNASLINTCTCVNNLIFDKANLVCTCNNVSILLNRNCINCVSTNFNFSGNGTTSGNQCICKDSFIWNAQLGVCICDLNTVFSNGTCIPCNQITNTIAANKTSCVCINNLIFDPINLVCTCSGNTSIIFNRACLNCASASFNFSGNGTVAGNQCSCKFGFIWNPKLGICNCDVNFAFGSNSCIPCSNFTYTVPSTTASCTCINNLVFDPLKLVCTCSGTTSFISNATCINCAANNANFSGKGVVSGNQCSCKTSFVWNAQLLTCICGVNYVYINGTCYLCSQIGNTVASNQSQLSSCTCLNNLIFDPMNLKCSCNDTSILFNKACINCVGQNANFSRNGTVSGTQCSCKDTFIWSPTLGTCICDVNFAYGNGTCIPCNQILNTGVSTKASCVCINNLIFDPINLVCTCNSTSIIFNNACLNCASASFNFSGNGTVAGNQCSCKFGFIWNPKLGICNCDVNFAFGSNSCIPCRNFTNTVPSTTASCTCINNLVFDPVKLVCTCSGNTSIIRQQMCVDCTSTVINGISRVNITTCQCSATLNLVWSSTTQTCICSTGSIVNNNGNACIKCSTIPYSTSTAVLTVSCKCLATFIWSSNTLSCVCNSSSVVNQAATGAPSCKNCDIFAGASGVDPNDNTKCQCLGSLTWDSLKKVCVCSVSTNSTNVTSYSIIGPDATCIPCSNITDPNIVNPPVDAYNCKCADPYFWDNIKMKCVSCTTLANSASKKATVELSCVCKANYFFDVYTNQCLLSPKYPCIAANISNCVNCNLIALADTSLGPIPSNSSAYVNDKDVSLITKQYSTLSATISKYKTYQCSCTGTSYWEPTRLRCQTVFE